MAFNNIEQRSYLYDLVHFVVDKLYHLFYDISVEDESEIEQGKDAVIYAPNHQNALMDPLAVLFTRKSDLVFYARSDIFKIDIVAKILYFFKILPVFRIRDGFDQLKKNQKIFDKTMDVISNGNGLVVFPEANHAGVHQLRPLKKGVSRVAFQAQQKYPDLDILIVPVSLDYEHYYWFRSKLHVKYGKPVKVREYLNTYLENEALGLNNLNKRLREGIEPLMLHVNSKGDDYEIVDAASEIITNNQFKGSSFSDSLVFRKSAVEFFDREAEINSDAYVNIKAKVAEYIELLKKYRISDSVLESTMSKSNSLLNSIALVLLLPVFIIGFVFNYIPYKLPALNLRGVEDKQFISTLSFAFASLLYFPLFYTVYFFLLKGFLGVGFSIAFLLFTLSCGYITYNIWVFVKKNLKRNKALRIIKMDKNILSLRKEIISYYTNRA